MRVKAVTDFTADNGARVKTGEPVELTGLELETRLKGGQVEAIVEPNKTYTRVKAVKTFTTAAPVKLFQPDKNVYVTQVHEGDEIELDDDALRFHTGNAQVVEVKPAEPEHKPTPEKKK